MNNRKSFYTVGSKPPKRCSKETNVLNPICGMTTKALKKISLTEMKFKQADEAKMFTILHIDNAGKLKFRGHLDAMRVMWFVCICCKQQCIK